MFILISIALSSYGLYASASGNLEAGIVLVAAGVFSFFLSLQNSDLRDRLRWAKEENEKLVKKAARASVQLAARQIEIKPPISATPEISEPEPPKPEPPEPEDYLKLDLEDSVWVDPDPVQEQSSSPLEQIDPPKVITRTSSSAGGDTQETWTGERTWSRDEIDALIELYSDGNTLDSIALSMRLDKKDVVYKLTRLNFGDSTDLEDVSEAPNHGKSWSKQNSEKLLEMNSAGITLSGMAKTFGRTKLAIGWRLALQNQLNRIR